MLQEKFEKEGKNILTRAVVIDVVSKVDVGGNYGKHLSSSQCVVGGDKSAINGCFHFSHQNLPPQKKQMQFKDLDHYTEDKLFEFVLGFGIESFFTRTLKLYLRKYGGIQAQEKIFLSLIMPVKNFIDNIANHRTQALFKFVKVLENYVGERMKSAIADKSATATNTHDKLKKVLKDVMTTIETSSQNYLDINRHGNENGNDPFQVLLFRFMLMCNSNNSNLILLPVEGNGNQDTLRIQLNHDVSPYIVAVQVRSEGPRCNAETTFIQFLLHLLKNRPFTIANNGKIPYMTKGPSFTAQTFFNGTLATENEINDWS